jgi:hypothetical protein
MYISVCACCDKLRAFPMKVRPTTRAITRTYIQPKATTVKGHVRYEAKLVLEDGSEKTCTRDSMKDAVRCVKKHAGIKP